MMATTINQISEMLSEHGVKVRIEDDRIKTGFSTQQYVDKDGDHCVGLTLDAQESGEFIKIYTHSLYESNTPEHELAILKTCMQVNWQIKMVQCLYDSESGALCMQIDIPLEDNQLTVKQLMRAIFCLVQTVDRFDEALRSAVQFGKDISGQMLAETLKKQRLSSLIDHASDAELDRLILELEFAHPPSAEGGSGSVLH